MILCAHVCAKTVTARVRATPTSAVNLALLGAAAEVEYALAFVVVLLLVKLQANCGDPAGPEGRNNACRHVWSCATPCADVAHVVYPFDTDTDVSRQHVPVSVPYTVQPVVSGAGTIVSAV